MRSTHQENSEVQYFSAHSWAKGTWREDHVLLP